MNDNLLSEKLLKKIGCTNNSLLLAPPTILTSEAYSRYLQSHGLKNNMKANDLQHGGDHYKKYGDLQPWDVIVAWKLDYLAGTALKYIARWEDKGGIQDLEKAIHFLQKKIEVEKNKNDSK